MNLLLESILFVAGLLVGILILIEVGLRAGRCRANADLENARTGLGAIEGSIFGLMGLLMAFTFSGAASRFDARRALIGNETNAIGTSWLRLDLLPTGVQPEMRDLFRRYADNRIRMYQNIGDLEKTAEALAERDTLQNAIWSKAVEGCESMSDTRAAMLLLPALNEMIDITTTREMARVTHPPVVVFVMLGVLVLASSLMVGFGMSRAKSRSWIHILCFAVIIVATVYVILDMELPRLGVIRVDSADRFLRDLRQVMN